MKKKWLPALFLGVIMLICLVPLLGMIVAPTTETTENRRLAEMPVLVEDGKLNTGFLPGLGAYFEDHFTLRNQMVSADAVIQSKVFGVSNNSTVIVGTDDWLYYQASLNDYLGSDVISERGAFNIAYNVSLIQQKLAAQGIDFLFTVAPNKNTLYGEHMPYYDDVKVNAIHNIDLVTPYLNELGVSYTDLFAAFRSESEVLYRQQDSHWNQKGAVLAYDRMMEDLGVDKVDYDHMNVTRRKNEVGDLAKALYSVGAEKDWDYVYDSQPQAIVDGEEDWTRPMILTTNLSAGGSLLMYRDSFGNALAPLIAESYGSCVFAKDSVYALDHDVEEYFPDTVMVEVVERNLTRLGRFNLNKQSPDGPPIMTLSAEEPNLSGAVEKTGCATCTIGTSALLPSMALITGTIAEEAMTPDTRVYVRVTHAGQDTVYTAFLVSDAETDNGYLVYLPAEQIADSDAVRVITVSGNEVCVIDPAS